ncbi:hypothetical protein E3N88_40445 [Mikania micrantha]|uniref:Uncharacterized protein n=1 Tax=Mikania micrantha TaxID=192012 RepID=A0A5N6LQ01_9ASTR|nr:hypothetical protein E3N88_40445 [Mikania micrantha]
MIAALFVFCSVDELEPSNNEENLTNNCENDKLVTSLALSEAELYTDKDVLKCELPESLICHKEGAFHVKDICVDEGKPHGERSLFDEINDEMVKPHHYVESNLEPSNDHKNIGDDRDERIKGNSDASSGIQEVDADLPVNEPINDHANISCKSIDEQISVKYLQKSIPDYRECGSKEEVIDSIDRHEMSKSDGLMISSPSDSISKTVDDNGSDISLQPGEEHGISSLKSLLESAKQQRCQSPEEKTSKGPVKNKTTTEENTHLNLNNTKPATTSGDDNIQNPERVNELSIEPLGVPRLQDVGSVNTPVVNSIHRGDEGESSLTPAGPISGLVTYPGLIGFSGSTSIRSDSSTTSTRSFAFPM